jgi:hypothetical protein
MNEEAQSKQEQGDPIGYISEPVAKLLVEKKQAHGQIRSYQLFTHDVALYTTPPKQEQGELAATERQVEILTDELANCQRALEKQEQAEPVAYGMRDTMIGNGNRMMYVRLDKGQDGCTVPLYEHPQPKQEQGEPVAWGMEGKDGFIFDVICPAEHEREEGGYTTPLYTTPQPVGFAVMQKPWVGLTDEDYPEVRKDDPMIFVAFKAGARWAARKLKEKNT